MPTPPPTSFDPLVATSAVGTLPGDASVTQDGAFTYTIPLEVPPGRAGMQPTLAIQYTSTEAESALGVGFSLGGLSALSRCGRTVAHDGQRRGIELTSEDRLCLDGDRLVPEPGHAYGAPTSLYRPEHDALRRAREVSRDTDGLSGPTGYLVQLPDGRERRYGTSPDSRVTFPTDGGAVVATWLIREERDPNGNAIIYHYDVITPNHPDVDPEVPVRDLVRIASIEYTALSDGATVVPGNRTVRFLYSAEAWHPDPGAFWSSELPAGAASDEVGASSAGGLTVNPPPPDAFSHGTWGWRSTAFPLERIQTLVGDQLVREYRIRCASHDVAR